MFRNNGDGTFTDVAESIGRYNFYLNFRTSKRYSILALKFQQAHLLHAVSTTCRIGGKRCDSNHILSLAAFDPGPRYLLLPTVSIITIRTPNSLPYLSKNLKKKTKHFNTCGVWNCWMKSKQSDPDPTPPSVASDLSLHFLLWPNIFILNIQTTSFHTCPKFEYFRVYTYSRTSMARTS